MKPLYPPGRPIAPGFTLGRHLTIEYYGCAPDTFLSPESVQKNMEEAAHAARAHIVSSLFHPFEPQGISGVVVITESHLALHAWPEHDYAAVDIFTCSDTMDVQAAIDFLAAAFGASRVEVSSDVDRGVFPLNKKRDLPNKEARSHHGEGELQTGVSLWLDLWGVRIDRDNLNHFLTRVWDFPGMAGAAHEEPFIHFHGNGFMAGCGNSSILGRIHGEESRMDLDLFAGPELPIRRFAEFALGFFKGEHYKLDLKFRG